NPGQFDFARRARREGRAGTIRIESISSMKQLTRSPWPVRSFSLRWRAALRSACEAAIVADLPPSATPDRDALCSAMLPGNRSAALEPLMDLFRRTGLAHLVAISGFNLGVLAAAVLVIARLRRRRLRREAIVTLAVIVPYLVIVVPEVPV